jgi:hypothetical protein
VCLARGSTGEHARRDARVVTRYRKVRAIARVRESKEEGDMKAKRVMTAAMLGALVLLAWRGARCAFGAGDVSALDEDPKAIDGRFWVEKRPEKYTEYVQGAFFVSRANFGVFERASSYDVRFEFAELTRKDTTMNVSFPQTGKSGRFTYKVTSCSVLPPFDLCLDISENPWGGPRRYYGFSKPENEAKELGALAEDARVRAEQHSR